MTSQITPKNTLMRDFRLSGSPFIKKMSTHALPLIVLGLIIGACLRMSFVWDMEYKEDEAFNFDQSQLIGNSIPWPISGIPSGVYLPNPGMSIWVFAALAKLTGASTPTALAHSLQLFALLGIALILPLVFWKIKNLAERRLWLWAFALSLVNPFLILYQRKLWPEPFLPFFVLIALMGWWNRSSARSSFVWGFFGACLGQIHMSGFFYAFSLTLWTFFFEPKPKKTNWKAWFLGSTLGALPLVPWAYDILTHPVTGQMSSGWSEAIQLKYWTFWLTDPTGLHLGNPLGLLRGHSHWAQISDFVRYPIIGKTPTYIVGLAHSIALVCTVFIFVRGLKAFFKALKSSTTPNSDDMTSTQKRLLGLKRLFIGLDSKTSFVLNSALIGSGLMMTLTGVVIKRYYMAITFPLEFIFFARMAKPETKSGTIALSLLWISQLLISAGFVWYIHVNEGAPMGDYGTAYRKTISIPEH